LKEVVAQFFDVFFLTFNVAQYIVLNNILSAEPQVVLVELQKAANYLAKHSK